MCPLTLRHWEIPERVSVAEVNHKSVPGTTTKLLRIYSRTSVSPFL